MQFAPMAVNLLAFKANTVDRGSSITLGPYQQIDYFLSNKQNQGFGEENGDFGALFVPLSIISDPDVSDSNSAKTSII
ncbi:hypothetical protein [Bacillus horti]|uniref:Spore germination protein n=1 Tax=Caldalkalibacillus horti TaxID=77523 RepID=A0ABT9W0A9_9BACI|nr:hypothetical protein [Bacillus horti]MDQ0166688.1 hypothetical protein [Bacillus horti]